MPVDTQLALIVVLTFVIHLIGTLAYAFRVAGVRTGHIAIAFSLFNVLVLGSRLSNSLQAPLLAKRVETAIGAGTTDLFRDFSLILLSASVATVVGGLLIPSFQRYATVAVHSFQRTRSIPRLIMRALSMRGASVAMRSLALPRYQNVETLRARVDIPVGMIAMNFAASAMWAVGVMASIYAGLLDPEFRVTSNSLSAIINGAATLMMFTLVDPYLAAMTDDVVRGKATEAQFRRVVVWMTVSRLAGTMAAQVMLLPSAHLIAAIARML